MSRSWMLIGILFLGTARAVFDVSDPPATVAWMQLIAWAAKVAVQAEAPRSRSGDSTFAWKTVALVIFVANEKVPSAFVVTVPTVLPPATIVTR